MEKEMITLTTDMKFSEERLEEIFNVQETKELFERFMGKEENVEEVERVEEWLEKILGLKNGLLDDFEKEQEETSEAKKIIIMKVKVAILARSIQGIINGKSLDQAIQEELKEQLEHSDIFGAIYASLKNQLSWGFSESLNKGLIKGLN